MAVVALSSALGLSVNLTTLLVLALAFLLAVHVRDRLQRPKGRLPPGPWGLPLFGVLPLLGQKPYLTLQKWWRRYGDVYSAYMGSRLVIVLNGVDVMKECFVRQGDVFTGRPWNFFKKATRNTGLVFTDGEVWREHRRFSLKCLRDFGMGKVSMETKIHEEAACVLRDMERQVDRPMDIKLLITKAVCNMILATVYGNRFDYDDPVFQANIDALEQSARHHNMTGMVNFMPYLEFVIKLLPKDRLLQKNIDLRDRFAAERIDKHRDSLDHENPRDLIDAYLTRMVFLTHSKHSTTFEERQLKRTIQDLFITGTETMSSTMAWAFYFMAWHGDVQARVQAEIDEVVGRSREPAMKNKSEMPYTEATIMECQRMGNIAMFSVPRCTLQDTKLNGYDIPKGTWVMTNRWGVHASSKYWKRPSVFDPTRFIRDGKVVKPDSFIPFGMGTRSCIGEVLARMELFLFFTSILQKFEISLPKDAPKPTLEPVMGINMTPQSYRIIAKHR